MVKKSQTKSQGKAQGLYKSYVKEELAQTLFEFMNSSHKVLVIEYSGDSLNSAIGLRKDMLHALLHGKLKFSFVLKALRILGFFTERCFSYNALFRRRALELEAQN
jgi:hypothetical protein